MQKRNHCIDTIKGIACIAVVFIHYNWGGNLSLFLKAASRFAVPFFFFVAGFYLPDSTGAITTDSIKRKIGHTWRLMLKCAVFYGLFCIYWNSVMNPAWNVWSYTKGIISSWRIANMVISGNPLVYAHFWYLLCSFYCYLVIFVVHKKASNRVYQVAFMIFLALYTWLAEVQRFFGFSNYVSLAEDCNIVLSNISLLRSAPFVLWGICLKKFTVSIKYRQPFFIRFSVLLIAAILGCVIAGLEFIKFGDILMYMGTHITVLALSCMAAWYPEKRLKLLDFIGSSLSMYVYIYHIAVGKAWDLIASKCHLWGNAIFKTLRPFVVIGCSLLFALIIHTIQKRSSRKCT